MYMKIYILTFRDSQLNLQSVDKYVDAKNKICAQEIFFLLNSCWTKITVAD